MLAEGRSLWLADPAVPVLETTVGSILREATGTVVLEDGWTARVDGQGNLILDRSRAATRWRSA